MESKSELAKQAQREYMRNWKKQNRDKCNQYMKKWRDQHPEKIREYNQRFWEKKALEMQNKE